MLRLPRGLCTCVCNSVLHRRHLTALAQIRVFMFSPVASSEEQAQRVREIQDACRISGSQWSGSYGSVGALDGFVEAMRQPGPLILVINCHGAADGTIEHGNPMLQTDLGDFDGRRLLSGYTDAEVSGLCWRRSVVLLTVLNKQVKIIKNDTSATSPFHGLEKGMLDRKQAFPIVIAAAQCFGQQFFEGVPLPDGVRGVHLHGISFGTTTSLVDEDFSRAYHMELRSFLRLTCGLIRDMNSVRVSDASPAK